MKEVAAALAFFFSIPGVLFQKEMGDEPFQMSRSQRSDGNGDTELLGIKTQRHLKQK